MNVLKNLTHRDSLGWWLNDAGLTGQGVEVGVLAGQFSRKILSTWKGANLFMVDPLVPHPGYLEKHDKIDFDDCVSQILNLQKETERAVLVRKFSVEAASKFVNNSLDFVYIDAAHDYRNVLADLDAWTPKVKPGGLVGGHDFYTSHEHGACCDVDRAVIRWCKERNIVFSVTPCSSWWYIK